MKNILLSASAVLLASVSSAHADQLEGAYVGAQVGYHDIASEDDGLVDLDISGGLFGGYAGYNVRAGNGVIVGAEGNFNYGIGDLNWEGGVTAHVGTEVAKNAMIFLRGGYQWVNLDVDNIVEDALGLSLAEFNQQSLVALDSNETDGSYIFGGGGQFAISDNMSARVILDTIEFDTFRATAGIAIHF